jgi:hypothetical protein
MAGADALAARLWCYLETDRIAPQWNYPLFDSEPSSTRWMPAIADLLLLSWRQRRQVAARVARAGAIIAEHDGRYQVEVLPGRDAGSWHLRVRRQRRAGKQTSAPALRAVAEAWRASAGAPAAANELLVLHELAGRRGAGCVLEQLAAGVGSLSDLLAADQSADAGGLDAPDRKRGRPRLAELLERVREARPV